MQGNSGKEKRDARRAGRASLTTRQGYSNRAIGNPSRHGFAGGPKTHGQSDRQRAPGSIGATSGMSRVIKGLKMAGRMGNARVSSQNIRVVRVDPDRNLIAVRGSVPGSKGSLVTIRNAVKG
jgi:large subunit ribosomal protein L3